MANVYDVIVIGSGPAGLTAALYASRAGLSVLVAAGYEAGGQLMLTTDVENFPGFPEGIQGPDLMMRMRKQAERFGAEIVDKDVSAVDFSGRPFRVELGSEWLEGRSVIIATGAKAKWLELPSEQRLRGRGVSTCATCDGFFFKGGKLVVVGGGDTAMEEALYLSKIAEKVTVVHRRDTLRASKIMQERAFANPKIDFIWNSEVVEVLGDQTVTGAKLRNNQTGDITEIECDAIFVAIGHTPNTDFLKGAVELDEQGYVKMYPGMRTSVEGVFVAGDAQDYRYRQAITAAADGCKAAIEAERWLAETESADQASAAGAAQGRDS